MKEHEVQAVTARIAIQLRNNRFGLCHKIIEELIEAWQQRHDPPTAIAELDIPERLINMLDREGYIYISDFDDFGDTGIDEWNLSGLGVTYKKDLKAALLDARDQKERADLRVKRKEEAEREAELGVDYAHHEPKIRG